MGAVKTVKDLGEDGLVRAICEKLPGGERVLIGPGDDCAVISGAGKEDFLLKTDAVVEGVHYLKETEPERVGWKAVARVLSDFAAMGGKGRELVVTLAISGSSKVSWVEGLYAGMARCAERHGVIIVGGETTAIPEGSATVISVAGTGAVPKGRAVSRSGGKVGDALFVTGALGGSLAGKHLDFYPRLSEAAWLSSNCLPTAMMDLSDGLALDLKRMAGMSGCGYHLKEEAIPRTEGCSLEAALGDGEDFELLFSLSPDRAESLEESWPGGLAPLSRIGTLVELSWGEERAGGYGHFD